MSESIVCEAIGIPQHLWILNKLEDQVFEDDEILFRRIRVQLPDDYETDDDLALELFEIKDDSYNRSKYCLFQNDVLYDTRPESNGNHLDNWGIISISVRNLKVKSPFLLNGVHVECELLPIHCPVLCNYPHTEAWFFKDGEKISKKKPRSMKTLFRRSLIKSIRLEKNFEPL